MGVKSSIERTRLSNGQPDPNVAYAPHGYDLVVDTEFSSKSSPVRLEFIFQRISEKGRQLKMPIWLGEWGAYYKDGINMTEIARHSVDLIQKYQFSNAYWSYEKGTENLDYFQNALL